MAVISGWGRGQVKKPITALEDPPPGGKFKSVQAVSIIDSYRTTLTIVISDQEIILLDVGSHDEVYR